MYFEDEEICSEEEEKQLYYQESLLNHFELQPNPADRFTLVVIDQNFTMPSELVLLDLSGSELNRFKTNGFNPLIISCNGFSAGLYLCRLFYIDGSFETLKLNIVR
ncbi:MAG: hypothetical protein ABIO46_04320 [Chitinophagales bacterium]